MILLAEAVAVVLPFCDTLLHFYSCCVEGHEVVTFRLSVHKSRISSLEQSVLTRLRSVAPALHAIAKDGGVTLHGSRGLCVLVSRLAFSSRKHLKGHQFVCFYFSCEPYFCCVCCYDADETFRPFHVATGNHVLIPTTWFWVPCSVRVVQNIL